MAAMVLQTPEMALSKPEAEAVSQAALNVARWYSPITAGASKWGDWLALGGTLGIIYLPRLGAIRARKMQGLKPPEPVVQ